MQRVPRFVIFWGACSGRLCYTLPMDIPLKSVLGSLALLLGVTVLANAVQTPAPSRRSQVQFIGLDHQPVVLSGQQIVSIHSSSYVGVKGQTYARLYLSGLERPIDVLGTLDEVVNQIGGDWIQVQAAGSFLGLGSNLVPLLLDPKRVVSVQTSTKRRGQDDLTDVRMDGGFIFRVLEPVPRVRALLG